MPKRSASSLCVREEHFPFVFKPYSVKQKRVLWWWRDGSIFQDHDGIIADGSIRSGKTVSMIPSFLMWSLDTFAYENFIISGKTLGTVTRNVVDVAAKMLETWGIKYRKNEQKSFLEVGSNIYYIFGANDEKAQYVIQGLTAAGCYADDAATMPQSFVEQMIARCSVDGSKFFLNLNPASPFHYLKTEYIDKAREKRFYRLQFTMDDNLTLSEAVKARYRRMYSGVFYKRYILGLWVLAEGLVYDQYDEDQVLIDKKNLPDTFDERIITIDYGTGNATVFLDVGIKWQDHPDAGRCRYYYFLREYYYSGGDIGVSKTNSQYALDLKLFCKHGKLNHETIETIVDPSALSFKTELKQNGFTNIVDAINDVLEGIRTTASVLGQGRLRIVKGECPETRKEFVTYSWDKNGQERGEDVPIKKNDHGMDGTRYTVMTKETEEFIIFA